MPETLEIMFEDLNQKAQKEVLAFYGYTDPAEGNLDVFPLFVLHKDGGNGGCGEGPTDVQPPET